MKEAVSELSDIDIFELDVTKLKFTDNDDKNLSISNLLGEDKSSDYDPFLKERGFSELIGSADSEFKKDFAKTIMSAESEVGTIDLPSLIDSKHVGIIRSKETVNNIKLLTDFITEENNKLNSIPQNPVILNIPYKELNFNSMLTGKFKRNHIAFDVEADKYGHATQCSAVNYESKRIVVAYFSEETKLETYISEEGWSYYLLGTDNLWQSILLADYESLLACHFIGTIEQGSKEVLSIYKKIKPKLLDNFFIDVENLVKYINLEKKSVWICHNNRYDINQLNNNYKYKKGKRRAFTIINTKSAEFITVRHNLEDLYKIKLGNNLIGFRFNAINNTRYGFNGYAHITLAPYQSKQYSITDGIDTLNLAFAGQFTDKSLLGLSKGLAYEKIELKEEKIFDVSDIQMIAGRITEKVQYNIMDCTATLAVYAMLSHHFNMEETGKLQDLDLTVTKDWKKCFSSSIISPATIAKFDLQTLFKTRTGFSIKEIESNFQLTRQYMSNFKDCYHGGRTEAYIFGLIENQLADNPKDDLIIKYPDFEQQYANSARLIQAEKQLLMSAEGKLHEVLNNELKPAKEAFWKTVEYVVQTKKDNVAGKDIPLKDNFLEEILGTVRFKLTRGSLTIRKKIKPKKRKKKVATDETETKKKSKDDSRSQDIIISGDNNSAIKMSLPDLLWSVEYEHLINKVPIKKLKKRIKFLEAERLLLGVTSEFGEEFFSQTIKQRREIKSALALIKIQLKATKEKKYVSELTNQHYEYLLDDGLTKREAFSLIERGINRILTNIEEIEPKLFTTTEKDEFKSTINQDNLATVNISDIINIQNKFEKISNNLLEFLETKYNATEQLLKYILNSAYGVSAEGIAPDKDFTGKYQVPSVACLITACARYLSYSAQILYELHKGLPIYSDTDSLPARATEATHKQVFRYFKATIPLKEERGFGKITKFYVNGKKKYSLENADGEIFTKIHGTAGYRDTKEFYQELYSYKMNTTLPNSEIVKITLPLHPIHQGVTYKKKTTGKTDKFLLMKDMIKNGEKLREYEYVSGNIALTLFLYKKDDNYLYINTTEINKGMFGSYLKVERKSNSSIYVCILAPCNFNDVLHYIIEQDKETEIFNVIRKGQDKTRQKLLDNYYGSEQALDSMKEKIEQLPESEIIIKIYKKTKLFEKFMKFLQYKGDRFHRKRVKLPNKTYDLMIPKNYKHTIRDEPIKEYVNRDQFDCDGFDYCYSVQLPNPQFSGNLKTSISRYYSMVIENLIHHGSLIYAKTHYNQTKFNEFKEKLLKKDISYNKLPCMKGGKYKTNVLIPLKFQIHLDKNTTRIDPKNIALIFDSVTRDQLIKKGVLELNNGIYFVMKKFPFKQALKQAYKNEWIQENWLDKRWSISIERRSSLDYNCMLSFKITVGEDRILQVSLRLNPSSKNLYNLDLFETNLKELDEGASIGKLLIKKLINENINTYLETEKALREDKSTLISFYDQQRSTHIEDIQNSSKPFEAYKATYLTIAHKLIKKKVESMSYKLGTIGYAINLKTLTPVALLVPYLRGMKLQEVHKIYENCKTETARLKKMSQISVTSNRYSIGFNVNDYENKTTVSVYGKTYYQHLSKIKRTMKANEMTELPAKQLVKLRHLREIEEDPNMLRAEITIRNWENIHTKSFYQYLDEMVKWIKKIDRNLYFKEDQIMNNCESCKEELIFIIEAKSSSIVTKHLKKIKHIKEEIKKATLDSERKMNLEKKLQSLTLTKVCVKCEIVYKPITKAETIARMRETHIVDLRKIEAKFRLDLAKTRDEEVEYAYWQDDKEDEFTDSPDPPDPN